MAKFESVIDGAVYSVEADTQEEADAFARQAHNQGLEVGASIELEDIAVTPAGGVEEPIDVPSWDEPQQVNYNAPYLIDKAIGAGEAGLSTLTGLTGGALGMIGGAGQGMIEQALAGKFGTREGAQAIEQSAMQGAQNLTYMPRTQTGQEYTQDVGEVLQNVIPLTPMMGEIGAVAGAMRPQVSAGINQARQAIPTVSEQPTLGTAPSLGSAGVDMATIRAEKMAELPVELKPTEGMLTRDFAQQRFERETAKDAQLGAPLRQRFSDLNAGIQQNIDAFIDSTGGQATDMRSIGMSVDKALKERYKNDKNRVNLLYREAEKRGELSSPVELASVADYLTQNSAEAQLADVLKYAKQKALALNIVAENPDGTLTPLQTNAKNAELFRQAIVDATDYEPRNIRQSSILKSLVDEATENASGDLYRKARRARAQMYKDYENVGLIDSLMNTKKGTNDRQVAFENVLNTAVLSPSTSLDSLRQLRRLLHTTGEEGQQAWKDIQAGTLQWLKNEATKNVARDEAGNAIVSAPAFDRAVIQLDKNGKLDYLYGKQGADKIRILNDVVKDIMVAPPNAVNTSNTASVLAGMIDIAISGTSGIPAPIMTSIKLFKDRIKDNKIKAKINKALNPTQGSKK